MAQHVSQYWDEGDGRGMTGENNCFPASLARYLREAHYPFTGTDHALIALLRERITAHANTSSNPYTSLGQAESYLRALGVLSAVKAPSFAAARAPWTLSLVRGVRLQPRQYPPSFFNNQDEPDHFILSLPTPPGKSGVLANDPLALWNSQQDCIYTTLETAIEGGICYALLDPGAIEWHETTPGHFAASAKRVALSPPPPPAPKRTCVVLRAGANLRTAPSIHAPIRETLVPAGLALPLSGGQDAGEITAAPWYPVTLKGETVYASHIVVEKVEER